MDPASFKSSEAGKLVLLDGRNLAFVPSPLPPKLSLEPVISLLSEADRSLGLLAGKGSLLPNPHLLIRPLLGREAVLSSKIEGTQASLSDLVLFEAQQTTGPGDVKEVHNYVRAMNYGLNRLRELPLGLRFIRELHQRLMTGVRGETGTPGEFRRAQNWIGPPRCAIEDATFVPPPPNEMHRSLDEFEKYLHARLNLPLLVDLALIHYQFEAIHPFLDGNGRVGRLMIPLLLCERGALTQPILYVSAFFERQRAEYYDLMLGVSQRGAFIDWIRFFLEAVKSESIDTGRRIEKLMRLRQKYVDSVQTARTSALLTRLVDSLFSRPAFTVRHAQRITKTSFVSTQRSIEKLVSLGIVREWTGRKRNRVYVAQGILAVLEAPASG